MPEFVLGNGSLTPEGEQVVKYLNEQVALYDDPADKLKMNAASGLVRDYWVKVKATRALSEAQYVRDYPYAAGSAYSLALFEQQQQEAVQQQEATSSAIADELKKLREQLDAQAQELAALKETKKPARSSKKADDAEDSAESEA